MNQSPVRDDLLSLIENLQARIEELSKLPAPAPRGHITTDGFFVLIFVPLCAILACAACVVGYWAWGSPPVTTKGLVAVGLIAGTILLAITAGIIGAGWPSWVEKRPRQ